MRLALLFLIGLAPTNAMAGLEFCNDADRDAQVAIGYNSSDGWTSEGWWSIQPGECKRVIGGDLEKSYYYYRAEADGLDWESERYMFCTGTSPFTIVGDENCGARGYDRQAFNEIALEDGTTEFTMTLTGGDVSDTDQKDSGGYDTPSHEQPADDRFVVQGLLSHCDVTDAGTQCELHSDWTRYVSYVSFNDDMTVHDFLMELNPNTPVIWEGDLLYAEGGYADMNIRRAEIAGYDPVSDVRFGIQGSWVSDDDSNYMLLIYGGIFEEWYAGVPQETAMLDVSDSCVGAHQASGLFLETRSYNGDEPRCFEILYYDDHSLELWPMGGMNMLSFSANGM